MCTQKDRDGEGDRERERERERDKERIEPTQLALRKPGPSLGLGPTFSIGFHAARPSEEGEQDKPKKIERAAQYLLRYSNRILINLISRYHHQSADAAAWAQGPAQRWRAGILH